jgi:hypothetical protein
MNTTLTLDDHKELALCLHEIRDRVSAIMRITHPKLPKRSRASENIWKLQRSVDQVKCLLDSLMYDQHPDAREPSVYYSNGRMPGVSGVSDAR